MVLKLRWSPLTDLVVAHLETNVLAVVVAATGLGIARRVAGDQVGVAILGADAMLVASLDILLVIAVTVQHREVLADLAPVVLAETDAAAVAAAAPPAVKGPAVLAVIVVLVVALLPVARALFVRQPGTILMAPRKVLTAPHRRI